MKHAKDKHKMPYTLYLEYDLMKYIYDNIKGVSASQFINDLLFKEIEFIKALDDLYKREVKSDAKNT